MDKKTCELLISIKEKNWASEKKCFKCVYYMDNYKDDYTLIHFGYGEVKYRPACTLSATYGYVSHNPAAKCKHYKEK